MTSNELQAFYARDLEAALRAGDPRRLSPKSARSMLAQTRRGCGAELVDADGAWIWSDLHLHRRRPEWLEVVIPGDQDLSFLDLRAWLDAEQRVVPVASHSPVGC